MEHIEAVLSWISQLIWGPPLLLLILGTSLYLSFVLKGIQFRFLWYSVKELFANKYDAHQGDISPFRALMTTLAGALGTGSIVGVATAITVGGIGAIFWLWVTSILTMALKFSESLLGVAFRRLDRNGQMVGGPMEYLSQGLGWKKTAAFYCLVTLASSIAAGNMAQSHSIVHAVHFSWGIDPIICGMILTLVVGVVILGGVQGISMVATVVFPFMAILYVGGGFIVLFLHWSELPQVFNLIFHSAFSGKAVLGGWAGSSVIMAIQMGASRAIFSSEAGLGLSAIASAAAKTDNAGKQALIIMTGTQMTTMIVCTITALVIAVSGLTKTLDLEGVQPLTGAPLVIQAFSQAFMGGEIVVALGLILFAFTTIIAWAYYGEKCAEYLFGEKIIVFYRILFVLLILPGCISGLSFVWSLTDIFNGLMLVPNVIGLIALSTVIKKEVNNFLLSNQSEISSINQDTLHPNV
ncbi:MAG: sodium:alanine symporter family protein [Chlamydiales bacterium]